MKVKRIKVKTDIGSILLDFSEEDGYYLIRTKLKGSVCFCGDPAMGGYTSYVAAIEYGYKELLKEKEKWDKLG